MSMLLSQPVADSPFKYPDYMEHAASPPSFQTAITFENLRSMTLKYERRRSLASVPHITSASCTTATTPSSSAGGSNRSISSKTEEVAQALEIARESPDGTSDPCVASILENALAEIWAKVVAQPDRYVMTNPEFAVFNFFQYRFQGNKIARAARERYWDNACGS